MAVAHPCNHSTTAATFNSPSTLSHEQTPIAFGFLGCSCLVSSSHRTLIFLKGGPSRTSKDPGRPGRPMGTEEDLVGAGEVTIMTSAGRWGQRRTCRWETREEPEEGLGGPGRGKRSRRNPPSRFKDPCSPWPFFWPSFGLPRTRISFQGNEARQLRAGVAYVLSLPYAPYLLAKF